MDAGDCSRLTRDQVGFRNMHPGGHDVGFHLIAQNQTRINIVSLCHGPHMWTNIETQYFVDLAHFTKLQSLTWRGLSRFDDFESVGKCIMTNGRPITSLTLDLIDWTTAEEIWADRFSQRITQPTRLPDNFFAGTLFGIKAGEKVEPLPSLEHLSLPAVSFQSVRIEMAHALNMTRLRTLKLWNCPHSLDLLIAITVPYETMNLRSFEFVIDPETSANQGLHSEPDPALAVFLGAFQGLEDIYLMLPGPLKWDIIIQAIGHHEPTLRRLVAHDRFESAYGGSLDNNGTWHNGMEILHQFRTLRGIGTCMPPSILVWPCLSITGAVFSNVE